MIELGKAGTAGAEKGTVPVLDDGRLVATLHASKWKEAATATVGARPTLTFQRDLPLEHQVFLLWWELLMRRRATSVAAATAAGGGAAS